jgi:pyruvate ferredoxin oxidoreductase beta subunit
MNANKSRRPRPLPSVHLLGTGTPMCAGCGGLEAFHEIYDLMGAKTMARLFIPLHKLAGTIMIF